MVSTSRPQPRPGPGAAAAGRYLKIGVLCPRREYQAQPRLIVTTSMARQQNPADLLTKPSTRLTFQDYCRAQAIGIGFDKSELATQNYLKAPVSYQLQ